MELLSHKKITADFCKDMLNTFFQQSNFLQKSVYNPKKPLLKVGEDGCFWTVGKAMLLGGNSYVITLQKLCYYVIITMTS